MAYSKDFEILPPCQIMSIMGTRKKLSGTIFDDKSEDVDVVKKDNHSRREKCLFERKHYSLAKLYLLI